ncbi:dispanin subfamily A member 2b-like [Apteryx rowi]|uniref:dispanin subfamily A member 2b-like n=1 Tax=Apteryx rowi TaxID=308060 RepID=UPI000E1DBEDB|nr:dispanin subfamily A member 2b-like [Apteryx rowi]
MEGARGAGSALPPYEVLKEGHDMEVLPRGAVAVPLPPAEPPPRDHLAWSLCSSLYANFCCLGFLALVFSIKSRDRKVLGDYSGALSYGSTAKCLNITTLLLSILAVVLIVILLATGVITAVSWYHQEQHDLGFPGGT